MPQLDKFSVYSQLFATVLTFAMLFVVVASSVLPTLYQSLRVRFLFVKRVPANSTSANKVLKSAYGILDSIYERNINSIISLLDNFEGKYKETTTTIVATSGKKRSDSLKTKILGIRFSIFLSK